MDPLCTFPWPSLIRHLHTLQVVLAHPPVLLFHSSQFISVTYFSSRMCSFQGSQRVCKTPSLLIQFQKQFERIFLFYPQQFFVRKSPSQIRLPRQTQLSERGIMYFQRLFCWKQSHSKTIQEFICINLLHPTEQESICHSLSKALPHFLLSFHTNIQTSIVRSFLYPPLSK